MNRLTLSATFVLLAACGGDTETTVAPTTTGPLLKLSDLSDAANICPESAEPKPSTLRSEDCGLKVTVLADGTLKIQYRPGPDKDDRGVLALQAIADFTDCWTATDYETMKKTRGVDGLVESANGRSTWRYHPMDGLTLTCQRI